MGAIANAGAVLATIARCLRIAAVALVFGLAYAVLTARLIFKRRDARVHARARLRGRLLRRAFEHLGASFVKAGQIISSRPDVFAPEVSDELRALQDHVHAFRYRKVRGVIERELHAPLESVFTTLDRAPLAAGSVAQVHRGVLHDGSEVAVKILRPGVRSQVRRDAAILLAASRVAHWVSARARAADLRGPARSLVAGILAQTDLRHEAANYERFRNNFADARGVAFPRVHHELSTRDVLIMELITGTTLEQTPIEYLANVTSVMRTSFFAMCFEHGLVHADLHPGKVLVRPDGVLVMLDVGLVKQLSPVIVETFFDFSRCLVIGTASDVVDHLKGHHECAPTTDWAAVEIDVALFVSTMRARSMAELETSELAANLFALARKHRIRPLPELSLVLLGMITIEGIAKRLDPRANMLQEVAAFLGPSIERRRLARGSLPPMSPLADLPTTAPTTPVNVPPPDLSPPRRDRPRR
jgi:ubiquinone biosynthesis protein